MEGNFKHFHSSEQALKSSMENDFERYKIVLTTLGTMGVTADIILNELDSTLSFIEEQKRST